MKLSRNDKRDVLAIGVPDILSEILKSLDDAPAKRFFPNGINKIRIAATVGAASVDLEIAGVAEPVSDVVKILSLVRPMFVYRPHDGAIGSLVVSVAAAGQVAGPNTYAMRSGTWEIFDYQDSSPVASIFPDAQPVNMPNSNQVWFRIDDGSGATYDVTGVLAATNARITPAVTVTGDAWYLLDFGQKPPVAIQHLKPWP